jgi:hypothetical protein
LLHDFQLEEGLLPLYGQPTYKRDRPTQDFAGNSSQNPSFSPSPLMRRCAPSQSTPTQSLARGVHAAAIRPCPDVGGQPDRAPDATEAQVQPAVIACHVSMLPAAQERLR